MPDKAPLAPPDLVPDAMRERRFRMGRTVTALMLREMSTTYGRSPGGYVWALLEPVLGLAFLVFVFSFFMRTPPLGNSFPLFYATGFLPFVMFNDTANKIATSMRYSRPLLEYPVVTYLDAMLARLILTVLTHLIVAIIICSTIMMIEDTRARIDAGYLFIGVSMLAALGFGVGSVNAYLMTSFPVWERLWSVFTRPLALVSGLFFTYHSLPREAQEILWYNPLMHAVGMIRAGFYPAYRVDYVSGVYIFGLSLVLSCIGLMLLRKHHRAMMNEM
ncbi:MAG: ABC transporter permease [Cypionkella sp.]|nr:ABC transporter permease [Cypionkella sp.]